MFTTPFQLHAFLLQAFLECKIKSAKPCVDRAEPNCRAAGRWESHVSKHSTGKAILS